MTKSNPETKRNWRALIYAFIPLGFLALVGAMIVAGENTTGPANGIGEMGPAENALQASDSPLIIDDVTDPALERNTVEAEPTDLYDDQANAVTPTPSGPEGRDNRVIFEN